MKAFSLNIAALLISLFPIIGAAQNTWHGFGNISKENTAAFNPSIALDTNGVAYVAYCTGSDYVSVKKFDDTGWTVVGTPLHFSNSVKNVQYADIAINKHNDVYVAFLSAFDTSANNFSDGKPRVIKWDGVSWTVVGSAIEFDYNLDSCYCGPDNAVSLAIDNNDTLHLAFADSHHFLSPKGRAAAVMKFNGTDWVEGIQPFNLDGHWQVQLAIDTANNIFLASSDKSSFGFSYPSYIQKFEDTGWRIIANPIIPDNDDYPYIVIDVNQKSNQLFAYYMDRIMIFDGSSSWQQHSVFNSTGMIESNPDFKISQAGTSYIGYAQIQTMAYPDQAWVKQFDGTSWVSLGGPQPYGHDGSSPKIAISDIDEVYIVYNSSYSWPYSGSCQIHADYYGPKFLKVSDLPQENRIVVYPNPLTRNVLTIDAQKLPIGQYHISLINSLGQKVYDGQCENYGSARAEFRFENAFPAGVYYLTINGEKRQYTTVLSFE